MTMAKCIGYESDLLVVGQLISTEMHFIRRYQHTVMYEEANSSPIRVQEFGVELPYWDCVSNIFEDSIA